MALTTREYARKAWLETAIANIEAAISGGVSSQEITIAGRSLKRYGLDELESLRQKYDTELAKLEAKEAGLPTRRTIRVCF